jgi:hypothetical protein
MKFPWVVAINFLVLGFLLNHYLTAPSSTMGRTEKVAYGHATVELQPVMAKPLSPALPTELKAKRSSSHRKKNVIHDLTPEAKRMYENQLDDYISQTMYGSRIQKSNFQTHQNLSNENESGKNKALEERKAALLSQLKLATGKEKEKILRELEKMNLSPFESESAFAKLPNNGDPNPESQTISWDGLCKEGTKFGQGIESNAIIADLSAEGTTDETKKIKTLGFVVKSYTENKTFLSQHLVPVRPDDPYGCGSYKYIYTELLPAYIRDGTEAGWISLAALSETKTITGTEFYALAKKPRNVRIETKELATQ